MWEITEYDTYGNLIRQRLIAGSLSPEEAATTADNRKDNRTTRITIAQGGVSYTRKRSLWMQD